MNNSNENGDHSEYIPRDGQLEIARPEEVLPDTLQLIPLGERPYFPVLVQPVVVELDPWGPGIENVAETAHRLLALNYAPTNADQPDPEDVRAVGCVIRIHRIQEVKGKLQFIAQGIRRFRIREWIKKTPPYVVRVEYLEPEPVEDESQLRAYAMALINIIKELMTLNPLYNEELKQYLNYFNPNEPSPLADFAAAITSADPEELQDILETMGLLERMEKVLLLITKELEVAKIQAQITEQMQEQVNEQQKEFFLRQQLKAIQQELGISKDDREADVEEFTERLQKLVVPDHVQHRVDDELHKLHVLESSSAEYGVTRNYLDWITSVPWGVISDDQLDLKHARETLDKDHAGLDDVKQRIVEFLAVGAYRGEIAGS
ncbi:MAG TPA: endopeptidase La, partial [Gammaproteobacteria bacterium]|nr:endopeptidase La [Gammaproteobacteria bacterium]